MQTELLLELVSAGQNNEAALQQLIDDWTTQAAINDGVMQGYLAQSSLLFQATQAAAMFEVIAIGTIVTHASLSIPPNYLICDGSQFNSATYGALCGILGQDYVPDLRGMFIRGWDPTAVNDPLGAGRSFGDAQIDDVAAHTHSGTTDDSTAQTANISGTTGSSSISLSATQSNTGSSASTFKLGSGNATTVVTGTHSHSLTGSVSIPPHSHTITTSANGSSTETRPKNVTMVFMIKAL